MNENKEVKDAPTRPTTKIGLWLFVPGASWMLAMLSGTLKESAHLDALIMISLGAMAAVAYGAIFLLISGIAELYKFTLFQRFVNRTNILIGSFFFTGMALALVVLALYLVYLFVLWAGLIGTLLFLIALLLFVLVLLAASR
jgi:hypothetical protein